MVILPEMVKVTLPNTNVRSFLSDWFDACKCYSEEKNLPLLDLGFRYYYSEKTRENHIKYEENGKSYDILLSNASSGLQSVAPMVMVIEYLTSWIYIHEENMSLKKRERIHKLFLWYVSAPTHIMETDQQVARGEVNAPFITEEELKRERKTYDKIRTNLFTTQNSQFIIEEPELNLFPETQRDLIYYLLEKCSNEEREHRMTITTHSPYILYALNNCMMAGLVYDRMREKDKERLKCKSALIDPKKVSIYQIDDGKLNPIQQDDRLIGDNYFDKNMKELMDDYYLMLNYYET
jgi:predicted ATPase